MHTQSKCEVGYGIGEYSAKKNQKKSNQHSPMNDAKKLMELTPAEIQRIVETLLLIPDICKILKIHKKNVNF